MTTKDNKKNKIELDYDTLKKILDYSHDEIYVTNAEGIVIYVNKASERHYGVKAEDIIGKTSKEINEKKYWSPRLSPIAIKEKNCLTIEQKTCLGKTLLTTATPVYDEQGNLEMIVENSRDITESEGIRHQLEISKKLLERYKLEVEELRKKEVGDANFVHQSKKMKNVLELAKRVATIDSTLLLLGESGTGKGVLAKFIHNNSLYSKGPFIAINCAAIPAELMESELFGYARGTFTGGNEKGKIGLIELADGGTLFLDEIAEMPIHLQAKLLQVLQERQYYQVGGRKLKKVNCRIIAATNRNLTEMIANGEFREDLYYRLNTFEIELPPLRERVEDIPLLVDHFLQKFNKKYGVHKKITQKCMEKLTSYYWPGNVRELENTIERLTVMVDTEVIDENHLPTPFHQQIATDSIVIFPKKELSLDEAISEVEKNLVIKLYKELGSSYKVAKALKISQSKANRLIRKYWNEDNISNDNA